MKQNSQFNSNNSQNSEIIDKIELFIQQKEFVSIPAIVFEYLTKESPDFDENDLRIFFEQFGEINEFILNGKISVVLFNTFFSANTCREFLQNEHNFVNNMKKEFSVRWFDFGKDFMLIPEELRNNYKEISIKNSKHFKLNYLLFPINNTNNKNMNKNNRINLNDNFNLNANNQFLIDNIITDINVMNILNQNNHSLNLINQYYNNNGINNNNIEKSKTKKNQKIKSKNKLNMEDKSNKLICKFEILIPNDKEFQIAKRLIGNKGENMKKIIDECKLLDPYSNDIVKLRLRGRGSGYKEGPQNKESDEPLHLCISAKNKEGMEKASECVNDLLNKIYEDYKKHCVKNGIKPISKIANRIVGGNSVHNKGINNNMFH